MKRIVAEVVSEATETDQDFIGASPPLYKNVANSRQINRRLN